jgi:hypothetical protein
MYLVRFEGRGEEFSVMSRLLFGSLRHETSLILIEEPGCQWQQIYGPYLKRVSLCHSQVASCPSHFLQTPIWLQRWKALHTRRPPGCRLIRFAHFCKLKIKGASDYYNYMSRTHKTSFRFTERRVSRYLPCYWCYLWRAFIVVCEALRPEDYIIFNYI